MSLSAAERETIVRFSDDPDEPLTVYTSRKGAARKLLASGAKLVRQDIFGYRLEMPRSWFRWPKPPRVASPAQAAAARRAREAAMARTDAAGGASQRPICPPADATGPEGQPGRKDVRSDEASQVGKGDGDVS